MPQHNIQTLPVYVSNKKKGTWKIRLSVQPGAQTNAIAGIQDDRLKIRLQAPPVAGKANSALLAFMAQCFCVRKKQLSILSGHTSRLKTIELHHETDSIAWPA